MSVGNLDLLKENLYFSQIAKDMLIMISQVTIEGIYIYVSATHKVILGYEPKNLLNCCIFDFIHSEDVDRVKIAFRSGLRKGKFNKTNYRYLCANGEYCHLETVGYIVYDKDGNISGAVFGTNDISESKKMEEEIIRLDQLRLVGEMAASIAHEIRNPMTAVKGFLQLLSEQEGCRDHKEYFNVMTEEIENANAMITEFLSIARDSKNKYAFHDLNAIINAIYPLIKAEANKSEKQVFLELEPIQKLYFDSKEIRQLILNLVRNGIESMDPGGCLTIRTTRDVKGVILSIEDQGHGITSEVLDKLGTPFYTTKDLGTGLGLAICYSIASRNNASIKVKSNEEGSVFSVIFDTTKEPINMN